MSGSFHIRSVVIGVKYLKFMSNIGCLFTFYFLDRENSIKTDLHICNLWTGQFVSYIQVCNLVLIKFAQAEKQKVSTVFPHIVSSLTPLRTPGISGLKSQTLKPPF